MDEELFLPVLSHFETATSGQPAAGKLRQGGARQESPRPPRCGRPPGATSGQHSGDRISPRSEAGGAAGWLARWRTEMVPRPDPGGEDSGRPRRRRRAEAAAHAARNEKEMVTWEPITFSGECPQCGKKYRHELEEAPTSSACPSAT